MIAIAHAVTPSDTREPPRGSLHPANVASREKSAVALNLALQIADHSVRADLESYAWMTQVGSVTWLDTSRPWVGKRHSERELEDAAGYIDRAMRYIEVRGPDAFPWRFVRHPDQPHLVRFEVQL